MRERFNTDQPAWYHLDAGKGIIDVNVHKSAVSSFSQIDPSDAEWYKAYHKLREPFIPYSADREWGFGPRIQTDENADPNWVTLKCPLPISAGGALDHEGQYLTSATLQLLFSRLNKFQGEVSSETLQMLLVQLSPCQRMPARSGIYADVKPVLSIWLSENMNGKTEGAISSTMLESYKRMFGDRDYVTGNDFLPNMSPPNLISFEYPSSGCALEPSLRDSYSETVDFKMGYMLIPHNVDYPWQQLTLLSGAAKLSYLATSAVYRGVLINTISRRGATGGFGLLS